MNETVPCETCGKPTPYRGTKRCNNCWEVERRLPDYVKSSRGRAFARRIALPDLDDWVDGKPDAWDFEAVLKEHDVEVEWCDTLVDCDGNRKPAGEFAGWGLYWKNGTIHIGRTTATIARKAAALFVSLWLRGVSASFADKLMDGFIVYLERQENRMLAFLAEIDVWQHDCRPYFRFTREGFCEHEPFDDMTCGWHLQQRIIEALDPQPDEEIIVTFTTRKRQP